MKRNKKDFPTSDETREVLNQHETKIAKAYGCEPTYIFNIKNGHEPDPYPVFRDWFQNCAFGGGDVRIYLHDLEAIAYQAENGIKPTKNLFEKLISKIESDAETQVILTQSFADNYLDESECDRVLEVCDKMQADEKSLRELALNRKNEIKVAKNKKGVV